MAFNRVARFGVEAITYARKILRIREVEAKNKVHAFFLNIQDKYLSWRMEAKLQKLDRNVTYSPGLARALSQHWRANRGPSVLLEAIDSAESLKAINQEVGTIDWLMGQVSEAVTRVFGQLWGVDEAKQKTGSTVAAKYVQAQVAQAETMLASTDDLEEQLAVAVFLSLVDGQDRFGPVEEGYFDLMRELHTTLRAGEYERAGELISELKFIRDQLSVIIEDYGDHLTERALESLITIRNEAKDMLHIAEREIDLSRASKFEEMHAMAHHGNELIRRIKRLPGLIKEVADASQSQGTNTGHQLIDQAQKKLGDLKLLAGSDPAIAAEVFEFLVEGKSRTINDIDTFIAKISSRPNSAPFISIAREAQEILAKAASLSVKGRASDQMTLTQRRLAHLHALEERYILDVRILRGRFNGLKEDVRALTSLFHLLD